MVDTMHHPRRDADEEALQAALQESMQWVARAVWIWHLPNVLLDLIFWLRFCNPSRKSVLHLP